MGQATTSLLEVLLVEENDSQKLSNLKEYLSRGRDNTHVSRKADLSSSQTLVA
jgi:hypothetical protein